MNKNIIVGVTSILIVATTFYVLAVRNDQDTIKPETYPTVSTDPDEYQECVDMGGESYTDLSPNRCVLEEKSYLNGNF